MNRNAAYGVAALLVGVLLWGWVFGWFNGKVYSDDPVVAELEKLRDENVPKMDQLSEAERRCPARRLWRADEGAERRAADGVLREQHADFRADDGQAV